MGGVGTYYKNSLEVFAVTYMYIRINLKKL